MRVEFVIGVALLQAFLVHSNDRWHDKAHSLGEIVDKLKQINSSFDNVELFSLGKSTQKRPMYAVKISGNKTENKPIMFIQCLSNGNEWITGTQCVYFAEKLPSLYGTDPQITATLDKMDIVILPVMNVDGYVFTKSSRYNRNWRKSRRMVRWGRYNRCYGVDLNRNFGYQWGFVKYKYDPTIEPCHETFRGFGPFSEIETRNVAKYLKGLGSNLKGFLDFHQGNRAFQMPWKYTYTDSPDKVEQRKAGVEASKAIYKVGYRLSFLSCCQAAYTGRQGGSSVDWVYGSLKVKFSYEVSMSVRDGYAYRIVGKGLLAGINALVKTMKV